MLTNTSLIRRVRNRDDERSWAEFVAVYQPLPHSYVRGRGVAEVDVGDLVQDVFIALLRALPKFKLDHRKGRFRTWLWQVTMNAVADHQRRRRAQERARTASRNRLSPTFDGTDEADAEWVDAHRRRVLEVCMAAVRADTAPRTWHCFEERVLKGRPAAVVAEEVGITANSVCVNAGRVLDKIRARCADYLEEFDDEDRRLP